MLNYKYFYGDPANPSIHYHIIASDIDMLKFQYLMQQLRLQRGKILFELGKDLYKKKFGHFEDKLRAKGIYTKNNIKLNNKSKDSSNQDEFMKELYKEACKEYHPDLNNGETHDIFVKINTAFRENNINDFLDAIGDSDNEKIVYEKIKAIEKEIAKMKETSFMHIGYCFMNNEKEFYKIIINTKAEFERKLNSEC